MDLTLTIIEAPQNVNMINHSKVFSVDGGSLGRADSNCWVLPDYDRVVSSRHADISFYHGCFYLTDRSTNGTFHNHSEQPIGQGQTVALHHGDLLTVGNYRIKVGIKPTVVSAALPKGLLPVDFLDTADKTLFNATTPAVHEQAGQLQDLDNWLEPCKDSAPFTREPAWGGAGAHVSTRPPTVDAPVQPRMHDPLLALGAVAETPTPSACIDPLAALAQVAAVVPALTPLWEDEDDWWKTGSEDDHAPALAQAMHTPAPPDALPESLRSQPRATETAYLWEDQPHLHNIAAANVNEALGIPCPGTGHQPHPTGLQPVEQSFQQVFRQPEPHLQQRAQQHWPSQPLQPAVKPYYTQVPLASAPSSSMEPVATESPAVPNPDQSLTDKLTAALGLQDLPAEQKEVLMTEVAAMVIETISRLMDLLRARSSIKNELRVQRTIIQMLDNNPLKFSVSAHDAMRNMFNPTNQAFMRPGDAVSASFDDLSDHQVAVLAGMRAGYECMLKHFDPATLEKRFNQTAGLLSNRKAKNWEAFEQHYTLLKQDSESSYELLFGGSFAATYEQQLAELTTARNLTRPRD